MIGVTCRLPDLTVDDRGITHVLHLIALGDLVVTEDREFRVVGVLVPPGSAVGAP